VEVAVEPKVVELPEMEVLAAAVRVQHQQSKPVTETSIPVRVVADLGIKEVRLLISFLVQVVLV
jgi:hypothetical protein